MSLAELLAVFAVDINCQRLRKYTDVLFVLNMEFLGFLYTLQAGFP